MTKMQFARKESWFLLTHTLGNESSCRKKGVTQYLYSNNEPIF